ncbi:MAG: TRAP transporter substrate-binding protein [Rhodospirillaceae bacterium]|jgi:TRAP-type transport system periplasmic protein|nr:TRAP transporter substrate-binding protein [Rhodospirillaceae bacterium]
MTIQLSRRAACMGIASTSVAACDTTERGTHWDLSMPWGPSEFHVANALRYADEIHALTEGELTIHVHPGAVLGIKGPETMRVVEEGIVDLADGASFHQVGTEPFLGFESLPYLMDDMDELALLYEVIRPAVEAAYTRHGLRVLYLVPWPNQNFYFDKPIYSVADFEGLTMRSYDKSSTDLVRGLNMNPIQMPSPDVVPALASGAIDSVMTSTTTAVAQKYWEFLKYTVRSNHIWSCNIMTLSETSFRALSSRHQDMVLELAQKLEPQFWDVSRNDDQDKLRVLEANGMITQQPSQALMTEMRALAKPIWTAFLKRVPEARPLFDEFMARTGKNVTA